MIPSLVYDHNSRGQHLPAKIDVGLLLVFKLWSSFFSFILTRQHDFMRLNQPIKDSTKHPFYTVNLIESP